MRKLFYVLTFVADAFLLAMNIVSQKRVDWLVVRYEEVLHTWVTIYYGLTQRCEQTWTEIPAGDGKISYGSYGCRIFPTSVADHCDKENKDFCGAWITAGYLEQIAIGFSVVSLLAILFGLSTHSRRRRIWRAVAGLILLQAACQIATFGIITDMYRRDLYPSFNRARPGTAYVVQTVTWVLNMLVAAGVILAGMSADAGHNWAAGNRAYLPIA